MKTHFSDDVSEKITMAVTLAANEVLENHIGDYQGKDSYACANINTIYGKPTPGFVPYQSGGYEVTEFYSTCVDDSHHFTHKQTSEFWRVHALMMAHFAGLHDLTIEQATDYDSLTDEQQSSLQDYEADYYTPALLRFDIYVKRGMVHLELSINYEDAPYYRAGSDEVLKSEQIEALAFMDIWKDIIPAFFKEDK